MSKVLAAVVCAAAALVYAPAALADIGLGGGATAGSGHVQLVSDVSDTATADDASWIELEVPSGLTFGAITSLAADFNVTNDGCGGGSPRFQITVGGKNVFVYLGPAPSFTTCPLDTWVASGNLVGTADACRVDTSQHAPGTQCSTWAAAVALLGSQSVTAIRLVVDAGWFFADKEQTVLVRNVTLNGSTFVVPQQPTKDNPAKLCAAQRALLGGDAFAELWGTNANDRNAFGKCVSAMAKAKRAGTLTQAQQAIVSATRECKASGMTGAALGACVSGRDGLAATKADRADRGAKGKGNGKGNGNGEGKGKKRG
jgi:hypothetical protein